MPELRRVPRAFNDDALAQATAISAATTTTTTTTSAVRRREDVLVPRQTQTADPAYIPADSLTAAAAVSTTSSDQASSTTESPFFPTPTSDCDGCEVERTKSSEYTKNAVEGALIVAAVVFIFALMAWRIIRLRRRRRPISDFFRTHSHPHPQSPPTARPPTVPRTTGLPPTRGPPASVICDSLTAPVPLLHRGETVPHRQRRGRGRRTHAGDIDASGRRGSVAHPDDPNEFLPEYDDKDVLPRYQDLEAGAGGAREASASEVEAAGDAGRMIGVGSLTDRSPNGEGETSDTDLLLSALGIGSRSEDGHGGPPPPSSVGSHDGHDSPQRHG
ncbi:hypothetical protein BD413DRAFT_610323 [Trametes elegans]|nr:hypothetical protein BD413DRAFT_610323 [Trametes elegans]